MIQTTSHLSINNTLNETQSDLHQDITKCKLDKIKAFSIRIPLFFGSIIILSWQCQPELVNQLSINSDNHANINIQS
jgi:hypothetical protein